ncbi:helix-turn-helix domain-containing protein [Clostridioides sp. ZZV14-6150]|uniref:helix-turn-helix domain-containing protein n=1 Tax=Clostridioides sp. ZZV14-6150 TaxID=2811493 RepID=UPI001D112F08|nr:helix-turn-helix domain-containing protein [Clostridioides sp. ZZV14-6150]
MATFGERLKKLRTEKKLTQQELATILNINKSSISRYEKDQQIPEIKLLKVMADYFNISLDYLIGRNFQNKININENFPDIFTKYFSKQINNPIYKVNYKISLIREFYLQVTEEEFAKSLETSTETVCLIENNKLIPDENFINKLCDTYLINKEWIKDNDKEMLPFLKYEVKRDEELERLLEKEGFNDNTKDFLRRYNDLKEEQQVVIDKMLEFLSKEQDAKKEDN